MTPERVVEKELRIKINTFTVVWRHRHLRQRLATPSIATTSKDAVTCDSDAVTCDNVWRRRQLRQHLAAPSPATASGDAVKHETPNTHLGHGNPLDRDTVMFPSNNNNSWHGLHHR
eukprot:TRINITY_DN13965_c0_g1_i1.p1 TRINITY_DN13965_c0_g1~~TRINITY_DN13965_c0_g1_i1.p1  ORF type:complete len:116 (+),score=12.61 TRINITY_DN13965_c0_g1_i1:167-514(+)